MPFTVAHGNDNARLSFWMGQQNDLTFHVADTVLISNGALTPAVFRRDFDCGVVITNADGTAHDVMLPANTPLKRLSGAQAPLFQYTVDDNNTQAFAPLNGTWQIRTYEHGY